MSNRGSLSPATLPAWVLAPAILCWGWQVRASSIAVPLAALVAGPALVQARFHLTRAEFHRALDIAWVLVLGGILLAYSRETVGNLLRGLVQWVPVMAFPALLAQAWSSTGRIPLTALLPWPAWRRRPEVALNSIDLGPVYIAVCLLAMSTAGGGRSGFYIPLLLVMGLLLWFHRSRGSPAWKAIGLLILTGTGGWFIAVGLALFQQWVENGMLEWSARWQREHAPVRESRTAIGRTGNVGGSTRVVLILHDEGLQPLPHYLRIATYSQWEEFDDTWIAPAAAFEKVEGSPDEWVLASGTNHLSSVVEAEWARNSTEGLLPLPTGTRVLRDFTAEKVEQTLYGAVRADVRGSVVAFRAEQAPHASWESEPTASDHHGVPDVEGPVIREVARELGLQPGIAANEAVRRLRQFFSSRFQYSTDLVDTPAKDPRARTALGRFLVGHRSGHCEYFATAGVLLLRAAEIPARYATGFLVDPNERDGNLVVVRESQAHAWVRVWNDGAWEDFDPTPAVDTPATLGWSSRLARRWSALRFAMSRWWWLDEKPLLRQAYWLTVPLLAALIWRFRRIRAASHRAAARFALGRPQWPGTDSEWLQFEDALSLRGWSRRHHESLRSWLDRLVLAGWMPPELEKAVEALSLHERLRFDPHGLGAHERLTLHSLVVCLVQTFAPTSVRVRSVAATTTSIPDLSDSGRNAAPSPREDQNSA